MNNILNNIRNDIDIIDNKILNLINNRLEIVKKIGLLKLNNNIPLYDNDREKLIIQKFITNNKKGNLTSFFIENLFKIIFFESYKIQLNILNNNFLINKTNNKNILIIGGNKGMGKIFFDFFIKKYNVFLINSKNWNNNIISLSNLIIISVPISKFKIIFKKIIKVCNKNCIIVDILSNKVNNIEYVINNYDGPILSLHPMFGPNVNNFIKKKILYIDIKFKDNYKWFINDLKIGGFILINIINIYEHDKYMRYIQSLRYILFFIHNKILSYNNLDIKKIIKYSPNNNEILIYLIYNFFLQDIKLYLEIINDNDYQNNIINDLINILKFLKTNIKNKNIICKYIKNNIFIKNSNIKNNFIILFDIFSIFNNYFI